MALGPFFCTKKLAIEFRTGAIEAINRANLFRDSGYSTGVFGKWHLGANYPYRPQDRGFEESVWFSSSHIGSVSDYWGNDYFDDTYWHNGELRGR